MVQILKINFEFEIQSLEYNIKYMFVNAVSETARLIEASICSLPIFALILHLDAKNIAKT